MFEPGDVVFVKSDEKRETPMAIASKTEPQRDGNWYDCYSYFCQWLDINKQQAGGSFLEPTLTK
ncbi:hypothetical protein [Edaphocola aurantiacus]|uniref:hypothetical protein n=1 Tax=Edaphocola aurantiacus TaxID=2601682 RepID=UPI001C961EF7|nr:hypothetical protein [Edaphocola aurantiacus]